VALLFKTAENDRRRIETLEYQVEKTRRAAEQAKIIFQASLRAAQVESTERLMTLKAEYGKREAYLLKKAAENRRLLEEMIALEVGTERAVLKERALRRLGKKAPDAAPQPLEGLLDPVWAKVLPTLRGPVAAAFSRLRQIPLGSVPEGPRAMLRFAAVSLTQTSDMLKSLEEFYREDGIPAESRRAEAAIEAALASWEVPLRQRKISVIRRVEAGLPPVMVNEESLRVAVFQVLRNAYDAMPIGGSLTVALSRDAATGGVSARFSDTGPGFSPAALETLFAPFAGARAGHLGLGLGLARRILRRCGGDVEAGNNPAPAKGAFVAMNLVPQSRPRSAEMEP
jgi:signal transduction histidine kinase